MAIEWREDDTRTSPGRLVGLLLKYGELARDRAELFERGSLRWPDGDGLVLSRQHERRSPILRFSPVLVGDEVRIDVQLPTQLPEGMRPQRCAEPTANLHCFVDCLSSLRPSVSVSWRHPAHSRSDVNGRVSGRRSFVLDICRNSPRREASQAVEVVMAGANLTR